jgi:hypothetical protein
MRTGSGWIQGAIRLGSRRLCESLLPVRSAARACRGWPSPPGPSSAPRASHRCSNAGKRPAALPADGVYGINRIVGIVGIVGIAAVSTSQASLATLHLGCQALLFPLSLWAFPRGEPCRGSPNGSRSRTPRIRAETRVLHTPAPLQILSLDAVPLLAVLGAPASEEGGKDSALRERGRDPGREARGRPPMHTATSKMASYVAMCPSASPGALRGSVKSK